MSSSSSTSATSESSSAAMAGYLTGPTSLALDTELMSTSFGYSVDQLMELAGLSVAAACQDTFSAKTHPKVLVVCGPGNNGGDGLVAARHLCLFGYDVTVVYPKEPKQDLFVRLIKQCKLFDIPVLSTLPTDLKFFSFIVDAIFGFSFDASAGIRAPYDSIIRSLAAASSVPLVAVDVPSGWHVERGDIHALNYSNLEVLVSLTAPKACATTWPKEKRHYLGGRFVPKSIAAKYSFEVPAYPGASQIVLLSSSIVSSVALPASKM